MRKLITLVVVSVLSIAQIYAVIARPKSSVYHQPNGYLLESKLQGDEYFHFRKTTDNYVLLTNADGYLVYATKDANGELIPSKVVAHNVSERTAAENLFLKTLQPNYQFGQSVKTMVNTTRAAKSPLNRHKVVMRSGVPQTGATKFLVILVNFSDNAFSVGTPQARYNEQFNGVSYATDGATGSVKKYFQDNSLGKFSPAFDVYGPVKLSKAMSYYGGNDAQGSDLHPDEMVFEACQLLDSQINFADYDANNDGKVDNVYVIYAGYGEASGAPANTIWPHQWEVSNTTKLDGKLIGSYSCSNELDGTSGTTIDGIGTACHEFSHAVGLPDLYDTDYDVNGQSADVDTWSLMASGCYNNGGKTPPYYNAVEREITGWGTATELTSPANLSLETIDKNKFYKISTQTPNEYYLVENRQLTGWDAYLYGHGMIVYRVDKTSAYASRWTDNMLNAYSDHNCVDVVEADGAAVYFDGSNQTAWSNSVVGDPFPGSKNVTSLTDATTPNMKSWAGVATGKPITAIAEANGLISFKFMGGETIFGAFSALPATDVTTNSFTANWSAATNVTKYLLNVYKKTSSGTALTTVTEGFDAFPTAKPIGWTTSATTTYTSTGNYGVTSPSVKLSATGIWLMTPTYGDAITSLSFWYKGNSTDATSSLLIEGSADGTAWSTVETMSGLPTTGATKTIGIDAAKNYRVLKFTYTKSVGNLALDDISVTYGQGVAVTNVLKDVEVPSGTSYSVTGLEASGNYSYTVKAANATDTSAESNEVTVSLSTGLNRSIVDSYAVRVSGHTVSVVSPIADVVRVFDGMGRMVRQQNVVAGTNKMVLPSSQLYIVRVGEYSAKVVIR